MQTQKIKFLRGISIYTLLVGLLSFGIARWVPQLKITPVYPFLLLFFYLFSLLAFYFSFKALHEKISRFTNTYLIVNFLKLVIFSMIIVAYAYLNREDAAPFVISFFIYYLLFTTYEVIALYKANTVEKP